MKKSTLTAAVLLLLLLGSTPYAGAADHMGEHAAIGNYLVYAGDALVTRPLLLGFTLAGAGMYVASLPFTVFAQDPTTFDVLVGRPARAAFTRCLGCGPGTERR